MRSSSVRAGCNYSSAEDVRSSRVHGYGNLQVKHVVSGTTPGRRPSRVQLPIYVA